MGEPALIFLEDMTVSWVNPSAEIYFGHSIEYMQGKKCLQLFSEHLECMDRCPVEKAFQTGSEQILAVNGIDSTHKLIEAVPFGKNRDMFILAIIHSPPENHRARALRRDFAAALNKCATLSDASDTILDAIGVLSFVSRKGIYIHSADEYRLLKGTGVPDSISEELLSELITGNMIYLTPDIIGLSEGAAAFQVNDRVVLLAGRGAWGSKSRGMLELVGEVLQECIGRLTSGAFSIP